MKSDDKLIRTVASYKILIDNQCDLIKEYPDGTREKIGGKDITKVSELENDANYQNAEQVNSAIDEATSTLATKDELNGKADKTEIPTVNNAKITITQGGAEKGSFTLNQANEATIEVDAGGGGDTVNYLTFTAEKAGAEIHLDKTEDVPELSAVLEYDLGDDNWKNYAWNTTSGQVITLANIGDKVRFRGDNAQFSNTGLTYYHFKMTKKIAASGSVMTLLDKTDKLRDLTGRHNCFTFLFSYCSSLTQAPELPATTLAGDCYSYMFYYCSSLTQAPELPATTLAKRCYYYMFNECRGLTRAPDLPATTLATYCYDSTLAWCPKLNYVNIAYSGANNLYGLDSLLYASEGPGYFICPEGFPKEQIPAGWTVSHKTDIDTSFELAHKMNNPANAGTDGQVLTKTADAYEWKDATGGGGNVDLTNYLTFTAEEAGAEIHLDKSEDNPSLSAVLEYDLGDDNWQNYTWNTTSGQVITLTNIGDKVRFRGDNEQFSNSSSYYYIFKMTKKIAASGSVMTLLDKKDKLRDLTGKDSCYRSMFEGCSNLTKAPVLPATTLAGYCYQVMFYGCTSLTKAPELPATTLADSCYSSMFYYCSSLTQAPELPATTLADSCYENMFNECRGLTRAPDLPATTLATYCYSSMFYGCTNLTQAPELPATTLSYKCYDQMFYRCSSLTQAPELPATTLAGSCYNSMFWDCSKLNYISITYTGADNPDAFGDWLGNVPGPGYFICPEGFPANRIPSGWEVSHKTDIDTSYELANKVNGAGLTIWTGTQAEYDGLTTKDANTLYMITEEVTA